MRMAESINIVSANFAWFFSVSQQPNSNLNRIF